MKISVIILLLLICSVTVFSQVHQGGQKRLNQLEKVKLLEELELEDETAVKFFNLKDQHQQKTMEIRGRSDSLLDEIEETLSSGESKKGSSLNKLINAFKENEEELFRYRKNFLSEAENVLTPEKYAKYLIFERNFREEMRKILMNDRVKRRMRPQ